jgi:hypothetical protein
MFDGVCVHAVDEIIDCRRIQEITRRNHQDHEQNGCDDSISIALISKNDSKAHIDFSDCVQSVAYRT